ncbi:MAG: hypothetical protein JRI23_33555 [Deltaproteobacteria bacterium]|nr:hypothetical protein [Deltaproteobacteria bacterium]MBW2537207.1 hypothetical protein [Deltaproteobacteria bacterium]
MCVRKHPMSKADLRADIDAAEEAITVAEGEVRRVLGEISAASRASKLTVSTVVQEALAKLHVAKARLLELQKALDVAQQQAARAAVGAAEHYLDAVIAEMGSVEKAGTTWATKVVEDAFTKLRAAKAALADLHPGTRERD